MSQLDRDDIKSSTEQYRFKNKLDNETYNRLIEKRNQIFVKMGYKIVSLTLEFNLNNNKNINLKNN